MRHGEATEERDLFWLDKVIEGLAGEDGANYEKTCIQIKNLLLAHPNGMYVGEVMARVTWHSKQHVFPIIRHLVEHDYIIVFDMAKQRRKNSIAKIMVCLNYDEDIGNWLSWL